MLSVISCTNAAVASNGAACPAIGLRDHHLERPLGLAGARRGRFGPDAR